MGLSFGTGGLPLSAKSLPTDQGIRALAEMGLSHMELEFVRGVHMNEALAFRVREVAREVGVSLSVHAPYWINLNAKESAKVKRSIRFITDSARVGFAAGARDIVFHPAFYLGQDPEKVYQTVKSRIEDIADQLESQGIDVVLRPETTGKATQFGSLEELVRLSEELGPAVLPCVDFAHLHARSAGAFNTTQEFHLILNTIEQGLGKDALQRMHIHMSGIAYTQKGERNHLPLEESDMNWKDLLAVLHQRGVSGTVVCESPILEHDALLMQSFYRSL